MRKTVLFCAVVLVLVVLVAAPAKAATKINFGVKAGVSFSNVAWSDDDGAEKVLIRPTFGAFGLVNLTPELAIQPEIDFLAMGEWWSYTGGKDVEVFRYLHIPVLLRYQFMKEGKAIPFVAAGPAIGFLLTATDEGDNVKSFFKTIDFGGELGAGVQMPAGKMKVLIEARFYLGLTNNYKQPVPELTLPAATPEFTERSRALSITAGLVF